MNKSLIKNISYNILSNVFSVVLGFILNILIARILQPQQMGYYSYIIWLVSFLSFLILLGVPNTITKYVSQFYTTQKHKLKSLFYCLFRIISLSFIFVSTIVITYSLIFSKNYFILAIIFLANIILVANGIIRSIIVGLENFKVIFVNTLVSLLLQIFLVVFLLKNNAKWQLMISIYLFCLLVSTILFFIFAEKDIKDYIYSASDKLTIEEKQKVFKYLFFISASMLINLVVWERSEIFFLKIFSTPQDIAFYSIAFTLAYFPNKVLTFSNVLLPFMSRTYGEKDEIKLNFFYTQTTDIISFVLVPVYVFIFSFSNEVVKLIYGISYLPAADALKIITTAGLVSSISTSGSAYVQAKEKAEVIFRIGIFVAIVNILLDLMFIPSYKIIGAAYANSFAQILGCFIGTGYILIVHKTRFPVFKVLKYLLLSVLLVFILQRLNLGSSFFVLIIYLMIYSICYLVLNYKEVIKIIDFYRVAR